MCIHPPTDGQLSCFPHLAVLPNVLGTLVHKYLVSSLLLQMRNQGQESSQDLTMVAVHPGNFVTKLGLELGQVGVMSQPLMGCVIAVRSYPALE